MSLILRVALPTKIRKLFDYLSLPDQKPAVGARVLVPFGKQTKVGVVVAIVEESECPVHKLKPIIELLDKLPLFPATLIELIFWASRYYQCSVGEVFEAALPKSLKTIPKDPARKTRKANKSSEQCQSEPALQNPIPQLNNDQTLVIQTILKQIEKFQTFLLEGVTGSGKTEIYMQVIEKVVEQGKQALVLVPEIGLTPQILMRFKARFSVSIVVLHSSLTEKQRLIAWQQAKEGSASIIIGTRSSIFVPLHAPGIFIIDEEHDTSFKQQEGGFRYHARDLCIMRASIEKCPIILGTATPSLETLHNVHTGRFQGLQLTARAGKAVLPSIQVIDVRHKKLDEGLSAPLIAKMREQINQGGQVLVFLNRRGYSPVLMCFDCGWVANCAQCDAKMTLHYHNQKLQCHHCESVIPLYECCPNCAQTNLKPIGFGTERLEAALKHLFPDQTILRLDRDTTRKKNAMQETLARVDNNECQILLGTQMIAKGHHFPNITLVAILDIDHALFSNDFRSQERMGQLITQVAGRAGRSDKPGTVLLQTCHPNHPLLNILLAQGYRPFSDSLLMDRRTIQLPPYSYQILFRAEAKKKEEAYAFLIFIKNLLQKKGQNNNLRLDKVFGPIPAPMERRIGKFRAQLLLQALNRTTLQKVVQALLSEIETHPLANRIKWSLDVDPVDLY